ncbi:MAG: hypothetical protein P8J34_07890 [Flavobacteriales bacterium]|nr:hypothetical protein [Flavobacteriales bacterium]
MIYTKYKMISSLLILLLVFSCNVQIKVSADKEEIPSESIVKILVENTEEKSYNGWWVYGEGQHIFKDEESLEEWDLEFLNENMQELEELYLAICEMEYFPMECEMIGYKRKDIFKNETILIVSEFNILYIQGCGE